MSINSFFSSANLFEQEKNLSLRTINYAEAIILLEKVLEERKDDGKSTIIWVSNFYRAYDSHTLNGYAF